MKAEPVEGLLVSVFQTGSEIVGVNHGVFTHPFKASAAKGEKVGIRSYNGARVSMKGRYMAYAFGEVQLKAVSAF